MIEFRCSHFQVGRIGMYEYHWLPGTMVPDSLLSDLSKLYSNHYGTWGDQGEHPGEHVRLSERRIKTWLTEDSLVVWATALGELIGYAIAVHSQVESVGNISWVTQLVVHEDHRTLDVGKTLLFTVWRFSDYFAWGLLSANPYAVRALEKATRRRCQPLSIAKYQGVLKALGVTKVPYVSDSNDVVINAEGAKINTGFYLDHSSLPSMIESATSDGKPWTLGSLQEGWEWFAFTFHEQEPIELTSRELEEMLAASDSVTKVAYSRMRLEKKTQTWAQHHAEEVDFIVETCGLKPGASVLDFGCGTGRHLLEFARLGMQVAGVDYIPLVIEPQTEGDRLAVSRISFEVGDCRTINLNRRFDLGISLYDVIGTYADERENAAILRNLATHVSPGGHIVISVMNRELTERIAKNWFSISIDPDRLLHLRPSRIMENSGNVFDPNFYMIDRDTKLIYRKEQFGEGSELFEELIVRDRRYTEDEIRELCAGAGLEVILIRFVGAGRWRENLDRGSEKAKEILVVCRKPSSSHQQMGLFGTE